MTEIKHALADKTPEINYQDIALILETNNLRHDSAASKALLNGLEYCVNLLTQQTPAPADLAEFIIIHDGISLESQLRINEIAGCEINFVEIDVKTGYYQAKNTGFLASKAPIVVFADADCSPTDSWLANLVRPFYLDNDGIISDKINQSIGAVAGRTTYRDDVFGAAATSIDFMYFLNPNAKRYTRNFYANNVAFRREIFDTYAYPNAQKTYRGHCQILGMRLLRNNINVQYAHDAHTIHAYPNDLRDLFRLRLLRGQDTLGIQSHLIKTHLSEKWSWLHYTGPILPVFILLARLGYSFKALGKQGLALNPLQWLAASACLVGISLVDIVGAFFAGIRLPIIRNGEDADAISLDYSK